MTITIEELKRLFMQLLSTDPEFRNFIISVLVPYFFTKEDVKPILEEIRKFREDFNRRMEVLDVKFMKASLNFVRTSIVVWRH